MLFVSEYGFIPYSEIPGIKQSNPGIESGISTPDPGIPGIGNPIRNIINCNGKRTSLCNTIFKHFKFNRNTVNRKYNLFKRCEMKDSYIRDSTQVMLIDEFANKRIRLSHLATPSLH